MYDEISLIPKEELGPVCLTVFNQLHDHIGFDAWMITKKSHDSWIILHALSQSYDIVGGTEYRWTDTLCAAMIDGRGPRIAPGIQTIPAYANAPITNQLKIGSYIGVPISNSDGSLFGTLCAIDPNERSDSIVEQLPVVELVSLLLGKITQFESVTAEQSQKLQESRQQALTDALTGLLNRHGWELVTTQEQQRVTRYGGSLSVFVVDLDNLKKTNDTHGHSTGDTLLRRTADRLCNVLRTSDVVARLGGDEFTVLALDCNQDAAKVINQKITDGLSRAGLEASVGYATLKTSETLCNAIERADQRMYQQKAMKSRDPIV